MQRKKKQAWVDGGVSDSEEEYHRETQEDSQTQRPHGRKSRVKSIEPLSRPKETDKGRPKSYRHHPRPPDSPSYRPRAWVSPSPPRNPTNPVQEPTRRPNPQHNLPNKPRKFILDDGSPVFGRAVGLPTVAMLPNRKDDTSDEDDEKNRARNHPSSSWLSRWETQIVLNQTSTSSNQAQLAMTN